MKKKLLLIASVVGLLACGGCQEIYMKARPFPAIHTDSIVVVPTTEEQPYETIVIPKEVKDPVPASELIEDFYYVPLETTDESLFAYCTRIERYDGKLFVFDAHGTKKLFLFDEKGRFLKSLGEKGNAPFEFIRPSAFAIDRTKKEIVIYDNMKRKWMRFTMDGDYIGSLDVPFSTYCNFQILPDGEYVTATNINALNRHLGPYFDYKLLYTDSIGKFRKAAYTFPETEHSALAYDPVGRTGDAVFYAPIYLNEVYTVTDTALQLRYKFDYDAFTPFEKEKMSSFESYDDYDNYRLSHTYVTHFAENDTHLMFVTSDKDDKRFITLYDKRSKKLINFTGFSNDTDFIMDSGSGLYSYQDYFIAMVHPLYLKALKQYIDQTTHYPIKEENKPLFEHIKEDDNLVAVFFKIKDL